LGVPLGQEFLGKFMENPGTLKVPLGLGILGNTREDLENVGILKIPLGLEVLGKTMESLENLGSLGIHLRLGIMGETPRKTWKTQEPWESS